MRLKLKEYLPAAFCSQHVLIHIDEIVRVIRLLIKIIICLLLQKMKPSGRKCQSTKRRLLDMTVSATPQTPEGVLRLVQSPLPNSAFATPRNTRCYRDTAQMLTPYSPLEGLRRSERIASRTPTPMKYAPRSSTRRHQPRRYYESINK